MIQLLKYEFRKTQLSKLVILGLTLLAEVLFLAGYFNKNSDNLFTTGIFLLSFVALGGILFIGIESILVLHRDMNTHQGYMLYMTPNSCYRTLGAKVLENSLSLLLAGAFFAGLALLDMHLLFIRYSRAGTIWQTFGDLVRLVDERVDLSTTSLLLLVFQLLCSWLEVIATAFLADVLVSSLLAGKRMNGLLSFLVFLLINILVGWVKRLLPATLPIRSIYLYSSLIALGFSAMMYVITANIMEHHLSV